MAGLTNVLINSFLQHCRYEKNLSPLTLKAYRSDLSQFRIFLGQYDSVNNIEKNTIRNFLQYLYSIQLKPASVRRKMICLKAFFSFLEFEEHIPFSPFHKMKLTIRLPKTIPQIMNLSDVQILLSLPKLDLVKRLKQPLYQLEINHRFKYKEFQLFQSLIIFEILFATAIRVKELSNMNLDDIDLQRNVLKISGKGSKDRIIPIANEEFRRLLEQFINVRSKYCHNRLRSLLLNRLRRRMNTQSIRFILQHYVRKAQLRKRITPHTFRHTTATMLLENGTDIRFVQSLLGHSSIATTQLYTHISEAAQRKVITLNHPRNMLNLMHD